MFLNNRPRRNRKSEAVRNMLRENLLTPKDLIAPLFVIDGKDKREEISSMPGICRFSIDQLVKEAKELWELGVPCVSLFPALEDSLKNETATESYNPDNLYQHAIAEVKAALPDMVIMTDVALDPYSSDGHDGLVDKKSGEILNDATLEILAMMAVAQAKSGSDIIGPSDMMDGRVAVIREALDDEGFTNTSIMSYTAKYASAFYGPFRDALDSAPKSGDKKTYQMDFSNSREAIRETLLDEAEGADILMVKPGLSYLDVIADMKRHTTLPVAAYNVSGEYAMVMAAHEKGWLEKDKIMLEMLTSFKRAGSDLILTYFAKDAARLLN
jgi:porphobilinogen synthase